MKAFFLTFVALFLLCGSCSKYDIYDKLTGTAWSGEVEEMGEIQRFTIYFISDTECVCEWRYNFPELENAFYTYEAPWLEILSATRSSKGRREGAVMKIKWFGRNLALTKNKKYTYPGQ